MGARYAARIVTPSNAGEDAQGAGRGGGGPSVSKDRQIEGVVPKPRRSFISGGRDLTLHLQKHVYLRQRK